jgi:di/tricarboxylate transporter
MLAWEAWFTIGLIAMLIVSLAKNWGPPDMLALGCVTLLIVVGSLVGTDLLPTPEAAMARFGSPGLITVATFFVIVTGLTQTGAMSLVTQSLLRRPDTVTKAQLQLLPPVALLSAFMNNTPIVAMFMPVVDDVCRKYRISQSWLFLPLSYAAIFGGMCTLIGTSTNLIVNDEIAKAKLPNFPPLGMFELAWVGLPCAIAGLAYILIFSRILLPNRQPAISLNDDPRQYTVEMVVQPGGTLVGESVENAGLRHLPGLFLAEIDRQGAVIPAVSPREILQAGDRLVFVGIVESVVDLKKIRGLVPPDDQSGKLASSHIQRCLIEAVVSDRCPLVGRTVRDGRFRTVYNAAVLAIARSGERLKGKLGNVVLRAGDTLLLESHSGFAAEQRNSPDFFLVSSIEDSAPIRHGRAWVALSIMAVMVGVVTIGILDIMTAAMLAAGFMIVTRCCTGTEARRSVDISLLLVIGATLGLGDAMASSGAAKGIAEYIVNLAGGNERLVILALYFVTVLFTEMITNNAAAVLMFPIALSSAEQLGVDPRPLVISIMIAASAAFATPFGYQTNLMVYGPGGYRFTDYLRFGIPLSLLFMAICVTLVPLIW